MKKYICVLLVLACSYSVSSFAQEKFYVNSKDVMVANNGIFVNYQDNVILTNSISSDEEGIYFLASEFTNIVPRNQTWICQNRACLHANVPWNTTCSQCGEKRPNYRNK